MLVQSVLLCLVILELLTFQMFSLRLLTSHNYSGQTYELNLESLPSVSELIEGMQDYLEEKFGLTFPALPDPFKACDDPPLATVVLPPTEVPLTQPAEEQASARAAPFKSARKSSSRTVRVPSSTTARAAASSAFALPSTKLASLTKPYTHKVPCGICGDEVAYSNLARHRKKHSKTKWLMCDTPCPYTTPRQDLLDRHKDLPDSCSR